MSDIINKLFGTTSINSLHQTKEFGLGKIVIGMVHLPPLPGSPGWIQNQNLLNLKESVSTDVQALVSGGVSGIIFENYGDSPFSGTKVPPLTVSTMTRVIHECTTGLKIPFGVNVLRNDWEAALAIASVTGASFIRINILTSVFATDQGLIQGDAYNCLRYRKILEYQFGRRIFIFADINTKHGTPLHHQSPKDTALDLVERCKADGLIVTGARTGIEATLTDVKEVSGVAGNIPVFVGSGVNENNIENYNEYVSGFIVGTYFKADGKIENPVDEGRVRKLIK